MEIKSEGSKQMAESGRAKEAGAMWILLFCMWWKFLEGDTSGGCL